LRMTPRPTITPFSTKTGRESLTRFGCSKEAKALIKR
jgi:hypothetical protein